MSAPIITPALVRRYLIATGWTLGDRGFLVKRASQVGLFEAMTVYDLDHEIETIARVERSSRSDMAARLGMLAAAEWEREKAMCYSPGVLRDTHLDSALDLIRTAGVDPEAWEKARGA